jgi:hypothetical protein
MPQFTRGPRRHDYDDPLTAKRNAVDLLEGGASELPAHVERKVNYRYAINNVRDPMHGY